MLNPIIDAVPVFLAMMAVEVAIERRRGQPVYRVADTVSSLSLGIVSQLVGVFTKLAGLGLYTLLWQHAAIWPLPVDSPLVWLGALLACGLLLTLAIGVTWRDELWRSESPGNTLAVRG